MIYLHYSPDTGTLTGYGDNPDVAPSVPMPADFDIERDFKLSRIVKGQLVRISATPASVSAASAKIALFEAGLLARVETAVAAHKYEPVRIWYSSANSWLRSHAYVNGLGAELGLTEEQIDVLFVAAAKIDGTAV